MSGTSNDGLKHIFSVGIILSIFYLIYQHMNCFGGDLAHLIPPSDRQYQNLSERGQVIYSVLLTVHLAILGYTVYMLSVKQGYFFVAMLALVSWLFFIILSEHMHNPTCLTTQEMLQHNSSLLPTYERPTSILGVPQ